MSRIKTLGVALAAVLGLSVQAARATSDLTYEFAICTGRLSAQMEHQWLVGDPGAEETEAWRNAMASLLEAVMEPEGGRRVLATRIEAKLAHAQLLNRAKFNDDPDDAAWARREAALLISFCTHFVLT